MRIIFLGTPDFAVPTLTELLAWREAEVVAVVTQPDRPAGRGNKLMAPPTKVVAEAHGIAVLQPARLSKAPEIVEAMRALKPDVLVTAAFGQILKKPVLEMAPMGVVNLHGSLLPKYRGAAPINWALINGEKVTGLTTMLSDPGIDTGAMLLRREFALDDRINAEEVASALAVLGAPLMIETLAALASGKINPEAQNNDEATYAPMLKKEMGVIDWSRGGREIHNLVRGLTPWPSTSTTYDGQTLKVLKTAYPAPSESAAAEKAPPGSVFFTGSSLTVACGVEGRDRLLVAEVQPANRSRVAARDWANGVHLAAGAHFGARPLTPETVT